MKVYIELWINEIQNQALVTGAQLLQGVNELLIQEYETLLRSSWQKAKNLINHKMD